MILACYQHFVPVDDVKGILLVLSEQYLSVGVGIGLEPLARHMYVSLNATWDPDC